MSRDRKIHSHLKIDDESLADGLLFFGRAMMSVEDHAREADEIVRVKRFTMKPMNVAEAQLQMEMLGHDFFFFLNSANSRHSVLYRRRDGRLGLIESGN